VSRKTFLAMLVGAGVLFALLWLMAWEPALEDSFITFRVARNLWEGHGLVYNVGERVEAQSNMLWTLLLGPAGGLMGNYAVAAQLFGFLFGFGTLCYLMLCLRQKSSEPPDLTIPLVLLLFSPYFLTFTVYGLETPMQMFLLLLLAGSLSQRQWLLSGISLGLLAWCRPEGFYFIPPVILSVFLFERRNARWIHFLLPALLLPLALVLFRLIYYGDWQPNTVYAKATPLVGQVQVYQEKMMQGAGHLWHFFRDARLVLWLPLLCFGLFKTPAEYKRLRNAAVGLILIQFLFILASGGNVFGRYRFLSAIYPLLVLLAGLGWIAIRRGSRGRTAHEWVAAGLAIVAIVIQVEYERTGRAYWQGRVEKWRQYSSLPGLVSGVLGNMVRPPETLNARLGLLLKEELPEAAVVVTGQIGQVGFYSRNPIVDIVGLADRTVAKEGISLEYLLSRDPEVFLLLGSNYIGDTPNLGVGSGLVGTDRFRSQYGWSRVYQSEPPSETFYRFDRRAEPLTEPLRSVEQPELVTIPLKSGE
jgi:hypothetical protein